MKIRTAESKITISLHGEELRTLCKTLISNPGVGAVLLFFPQEEKGSVFQILRISYFARFELLKFCVREHTATPTTQIGVWENNTFSSDYNLIDLEECWFLKIHNQGLEGILSSIPVILNLHHAALAHTVSQLKPV